MNEFKKYLAWSAVALFAYMPFHIFLSQWLSTFTGGLNAWKIAKDIITAILVSALVVSVLLLKKYTKTYLILVSFAVIFLLLHIGLLFGTNQPLDNGLLATVYNNRLVWYLLIGYSLVLLVPKTITPQKFTKILVAVSTIVCLIGFAQWLLPKDIMTNFGYSVERGVKPAFFIDDKPDFPRVMSTIRDPSSLGVFLILPITILVGALISLWNTKRRQFIVGLLLLHLLVLFWTFSRSALLGAILAIGVLFMLRYGNLLKKHLSKILIPGLLVVVIALGIGYALRDQYIVQNVIFHADESTVLEDPNELRLRFIGETINGIEDEPEGHGPGTAGLVSIRSENGKGLLTENYYLQIAYEVGIIGLILFLMFVGFVLFKLWKGRVSKVNQALIASLIGISFTALLFHTWSNEAIAIAWFMLAGVAIATIDQESPADASYKAKRQLQRRKAA